MGENAGHRPVAAQRVGGAEHRARPENLAARLAGKSVCFHHHIAVMDDNNRILWIANPENHLAVGQTAIVHCCSLLFVRAVD